MGHHGDLWEQRGSSRHPVCVSGNLERVVRVVLVRPTLIIPEPHEPFDGHDTPPELVNMTPTIEPQLAERRAALFLLVLLLTDASDAASASTTYISPTN